MSRIKRSVSMYSLQDEYARRRMTKKDIFDKLDEIGVEGIELISDQMLHGTPHPDAATLAEWDELIKTHKVKPVCNDIFINTTMYKNRVLTTKEGTDMLIDEIRLANRLGFPLVRLVSMTPPELIHGALPYAEKYNVCLAIEIHAGMSFDHPMTKGFIDVIHQYNSPYLGIVVDTGIFCKCHPRVSTNYFRSLGTTEPVIKYIDEIFESGIDPRIAFAPYHASGKDFPEDLQALITNQADFEYALFSTGYEHSDYSIMEEHIPYLKHIHGKCFEFTEDGEEYSIVYSELIEYLHSKNYDGYISTEYEGNRFVPVDGVADGLSNVIAHQALLKKYIKRLEG